ncbi:MAG: ABC transporter ATP-binding protein [Deltaproteobacteria bacterium]|jgi:ABC-2 type transport system ATP-binding protein|nr:ABC transporter ATP-binding protein [Deltaproteobacteria bacterium]
MGLVVEARHLQKRYGDFVAVEDVSFSVEEGEIFGILGPNGAGKTTTVECLQGLRKADGGDLRVLGHDPRHEAAHLRRKIGSQLQESALPDRLKVWEALKLFSSRNPNGPPWEEVLEEWNLSEKRDAAFGSLSGGQQQRLFVALAVVNAPRLVFLDEMTTGLDPMSRRVTWDLIRQIRELGTTVVLVTHFMDEAENLCDRIAVIDDRRVVALDTVDGLIQRYAGGAQVTFSTDLGDLGFLSRVEEVDGLERHGRRVTVTGHGALLARVAIALAKQDVIPIDLDVKRASLEDVFLTITGGTD